jgi:hypothetical protein
VTAQQGLDRRLVVLCLEALEQFPLR